MVRITRRARRRLILQAVLAAVVLSVVYLVLPLDSPIRLALTFNAARVTNAVREATYDKDAWLRTPAPYNVELNSDVGYLIKTGYGTRHRVPLLLDAFKANGNILGKEGESFLIVGDWTSVNDADAQKLGAPIHDALKLFWDAEVNKRYQDHHRLRKYHSLQQAIDNGDEQLALNLGKQVGWELDALKVCMTMKSNQIKSNTKTKTKNKKIYHWLTAPARFPFSTTVHVRYGVNVQENALKKVVYHSRRRYISCKVDVRAVAEASEFRDPALYRKRSWGLPRQIWPRRLCNPFIAQDHGATVCSAKRRRSIIPQLTG